MSNTQSELHRLLAPITSDNVPAGEIRKAIAAIEKLMVRERIAGLEDYSKTCGMLRMEPSTIGLKRRIAELQKQLEGEA